MTQVFGCKQRPLRRGDMPSRMACAATYANMLSIESKAGLGVIEARGCGSPMNHVEVRAIVI